MNQNELTKIIHADLKSARLSTSFPDSKKIVDMVLDNLRNEISKGKIITLCEFGTFSTKVVSRRNIANPEGDRINNWEIKFKTAVKLKRKINDN